MARSKSGRLEALERTLNMLGIPSGEPDKLPVVMQQILRQIAVPNAVIAFAFQPLTGNLVNIAVSPMPSEPEAYSQVANAASKVAQLFQTKAMEVMKDAASVAKEERMGRNAEAHTSPESRNGMGPVDSEVGLTDDDGGKPTPSGVGTTEDMGGNINGRIV